jgi:hypothetical protein
VRWLVVLLAPAVTLAACGLDITGTGDVPGGGDDGGIVVADSGVLPPIGADGGSPIPLPDTGAPTSDSSSPPLGDGSPPPLDAGGGDAASCAPSGSADCFAVPNGWSLVAYATPSHTNCPSGWTQNPSNWVEGPSANGNLCACGECSTTADPSCTGGAVSVFYDFDGSKSCALPGLPPQNGNNPAGACLTDLYNQAYPKNSDLKLVPPAPQGGSCTSSSMNQPQNVAYASTATTCGADSPASAGCVGGVCAPAIAAPFVACVEQSGDQACPGAPFTTKHLVGSDVSFTCGACACTVSATCEGTMNLYPDNKCGGKSITIPVDGTCHPLPANGGTYQSYEFQGKTTAIQCTPGAAPANPPVMLNGATTICCPP